MYILVDKYLFIESAYSAFIQGTYKYYYGDRQDAIKSQKQK